MESSLVEKLVEVSPVLGISVAALWIIGKRLFKAQDDHLESQRDRIRALEKSSVKCEDDRKTLHQSHVNLQKDVIDTLAKFVQK